MYMYVILPNFIEVGKTLFSYCDTLIIKMEAVRSLEFLKFEFL